MGPGRQASSLGLNETFSLDEQLPHRCYILTQIFTDLFFKMNSSLLFFAGVKDLPVTHGHWEMPNVLFVIKAVPHYIRSIIQDRMLYLVL